MISKLQRLARLLDRFSSEKLYPHLQKKTRIAIHAEIILEVITGWAIPAWSSIQWIDFILPSGRPDYLHSIWQRFHLI